MNFISLGIEDSIRDSISILQLIVGHAMIVHDMI